MSTQNEPDGFKLGPLTSVIQKVGGRSVGVVKNEIHETEGRATKGTEVNQVKISSTLKIKRSDGEERTVRMPQEPSINVR